MRVQVAETGHQTNQVLDLGLDLGQPLAVV